MAEQRTTFVRFVDRERRIIEITRNKVITSYPLNAVPDDLYQALADLADTAPIKENKLGMLKARIDKAALSSLDLENPFPINASIKRVRLTYTDEAIEDKIDDLEGQFLALQGRSFEDTADERIELYRALHIDDSKLDRFRLGVVEMYGSASYANIKKDPRVSLCLSWPLANEATQRGLQINCIAEIVPPGDPFYKYMRILLALFGVRYLDTGKTEYPCAYKLWVSEIKDKSLADTEGFVY